MGEYIQEQVEVPVEIPAKTLLEEYTEPEVNISSLPDESAVYHSGFGLEEED